MRMKRCDLSVVIPVHNEADNIPALTSRLAETLTGMRVSHEVVFVDDGSTDDTVARLEAARAEILPGMRILVLSRNFGHQAALDAGLDHAIGDAVAMMDGDLQDPPELLPELFAKLDEGHDGAYAVRASREGETALKRWSCLAFYRLLSFLSQVPIPPDTGDFRIISRRLVDAVRDMPERTRFLRGMISWAGFDQVAVPYERPGRYKGASSYSWGRLMQLALDGITSFSVVPLQLCGIAGTLMAAVTAGFALFITRLKLLRENLPWGWASLVVLITAIGSLQLIALGIIGEYMGRIYKEVKRRPSYLVKAEIGGTANR